MLKAEKLNETQAFIDGKWVCAKPMKQPFKYRLYDAIQVLKGKAEAVRFYKQD